MIETISEIILLILLVIFDYCSCKVASLSDQEMEKYLIKEEQDEKKNL